MVISKPLLPPKDGYVEVDINGKRTYRNVKTGCLIDNEPELEPTDAEILNILLGVDE